MTNFHLKIWSHWPTDTFSRMGKNEKRKQQQRNSISEQLVNSSRIRQELCDRIINVFFFKSSLVFFLIKRDQTLKYKVAQNFLKLAQKVTTRVYTWKLMISNRPNVSIFLGHFCEILSPWTLNDPNQVTLLHVFHVLSHVQKCSKTRWKS